MKVRHFGFLHPNCAVPLDRIRSLIHQATGASLSPAPPPPDDRPLCYCPDCGAVLVYVRTVFATGPPRLDPG
jgi:hypothetical protein